MLLVCRQPSQVLYNTAWRDLRYFVPSSLTAFSMHVLRQAEYQVVIGQLSYKQIADNFNHMHSCHLDPSLVSHS